MIALPINVSMPQNLELISIINFHLLDNSYPRPYYYLRAPHFSCYINCWDFFSRNCCILKWIHVPEQYWATFNVNIRPAEIVKNPKLTDCSRSIKSSEAITKNVRPLRPHWRDGKGCHSPLPRGMPITTENFICGKYNQRTRVFHLWEPLLTMSPFFAHFHRN